MSTPAPLAPSELPSARRLFRSTMVAAAVAIVILVTMVLPAEYGVDPTGIGRVLGLKEMGEIKMALAREDAGHVAAEAATVSAAPAMPPVPPPATPVATEDSSAKSDVTELTLLPNQGLEVKLVMRKNAKVTYAWTTDRGALNYDTHADSPTISYHGYGKGTGAKADSGVLTAAFDGRHGWFWRNRGAEAVVMTLRTRGEYQELMRVQ